MHERTTKGFTLVRAVPLAVAISLILASSVSSFPSRQGQTKPHLAAEQSTAAFNPTITYATAAQLAACIAGSGVTVSNATLTGAPHAFALFSDPAGTIGFTSGIILSTGDAMSVAGPNSSDAVSGHNLTTGDPSLDALVVGGTHDAAVLEFDATSPAGTFGINYVFASEEYNEFVGSPFNDSFAFFLDGTGAVSNIARVPAGCTTPGGPVSVNTVSCGYAPSRGLVPSEGTNCSCFRPNDIAGATAPLGEMDGMSSVFHNEASVGTGPHHFKIVLADVGDDSYDSAILIGCGSLTPGSSNAHVDMSSSVAIAPSTSFTLTADLPASIQLIEDDTAPQNVSLQSATFQISTAARAGRTYDKFTITSAVGSLGPCVVGGMPITGATFTLAEPGVGIVNYATGNIAVQMVVLASAPGSPPAKFLAYTSGQILSPTKIRLFMNGRSVLLVAPIIVATPAVAGPGLLATALALLAGGLWLRRARRTSTIVKENR